MNTPTSTLRVIALATLSLSTFTMLAGCSNKDQDAGSAADSHADHDHGDHEGHDHDAEQVVDLAGNTADDHSGHDHADSDTSHAASPDVYADLLGEITMLPVANDPSTDLKIHHQHIPNFKSADGSIKTNSKGIAGMMSMTMPFPLAEGVSIESLSIGDKIKFTFEVVWTDARPSWEVTSIEKIDQSTEIDFTNVIAP